MKKLRIIGEWPKDIPENWELWNAPRPIYGAREWSGDFGHGCFYAAIDPDDEFAERWRQNNIDLDAWKIEYVTEDEAVQMVKDYYTQIYPEDIDLLNDASRDLLLEGFYEHCAIVETA